MPNNIITDIIINNVPMYAINKDYGHWTVRLVDGEIWFYGAYDEKTDAENAARNCGNGFVIDNPHLKDKK